MEVRPTALLRYYAHTRWTLTTGLDLYPYFQSHGRRTTEKKTRVQRSVGSKDTVETDGVTDRWTLAVDLSSRLMRSTIINTDLTYLG